VLNASVEVVSVAVEEIQFLLKQPKILGIAILFLRNFAGTSFSTVTPVS
jgi:hypothetical protein